MLNHPQVRDLLPQRDMLLLLDAVDAVIDDRIVISRKAVSCTESCYDGMSGSELEAYGYPISLMLESFSQSLGVLLQRHWGARMTASDHVVMFGAMRKLRFVEPVYPGDVMVHRAQLDLINQQSAVFSGETQVLERTVAEYGQIIAVIRPLMQSSEEAVS